MHSPDQTPKSRRPRRPLRVCFIAPKAYPVFNPRIAAVFGGAEVDLYFLATELARDPAFQVSFITADYGQPRDELIENVRIIPSLTLRENPLRGAARVWRGMARAAADIYFLKTPSPGILLAAVFCRVHRRRLVIRTALSDHCDGAYCRRHRLYAPFYAWSLRRADRLFAQNHTDRAALRAAFGVEALFAPNAHRLPPLDDAPRDTILWVARSEPRKQPELLLELARLCPDLHFTMVCPQATGDRRYLDLQRCAAAVPNLDFRPRVAFPDIEAFFRRARVFVNTSLVEGFPNTFIQACRCGVPILSLHVNPDACLTRYDCGLCLDGDISQLAPALRRLLTPAEHARRAAHARRYAVEHHDVARVIETYKQAFRSLVP